MIGLFRNAKINEINMIISREVKIWKRPSVQFQLKGEAPFDKKYGPYAELGKIEAQNLSASIKNQLDSIIDWSKPDEIIEISPKWTEENQMCKFTGRK